MSDWPIVQLNDNGIRPAGSADRCFYCDAQVGEPHGETCVTVHKRVRVRDVFEIEEDVPHHWTADDFEGLRNDGRCSADNVLDELEASIGADGCFGDRLRAEWIAVVDATPRTSPGHTPEDLQRAQVIRESDFGHDPAKRH